MKCLVVRFSSLGDIILTTPVIESLAAAKPEAQIHVATAARFETIVKHFPQDIVIHPFVGRTRKEFLAYVEMLSAEKFDMVFDLHDNHRSRMLVRRVDAAQVYIYPKDFWRRWSLVYLKWGFARTRPVVERYLRTIKAAKIPVATTVPRLRTDSTKQKAAADDLVQRGWTTDRPTIGIGWGARWPTKKVPVGLWNDLIKLLNDDLNPGYIVFAESGDEVEITDFARQNRPVDIFTFCGKEIDLVFGALGLCNVFVTSDSGLMHAAAALGVPTWGIFGPTHPALGFAPCGADARAVHSGIFCCPCSRHGKARCYRRRRYCFEQIDIEKITHQIADCMNKAKAR